jgi:hypothetical protein
MKLVLAETITPAPVSATSKKIVPPPAKSVATSTFIPATWHYGTKT